MKHPALAMHSEYSFLQSAIRFDTLFAFAIANNLTTLVLTDRNNLFGAFDFIARCQKAEIKPIIGLDLDYKAARVILIAKNYTGFQTLVKISTHKMCNEEQNILPLINEHIYVFHNQASLEIIEGLTYERDEQGMIITLEVVKILSDDDLNTLQLLYGNAEVKMPFAKPLSYTEFLNKPFPTSLAKLLSTINLTMLKIDNFLPVFATPEHVDINTYLADITKKQLENLKLNQINYQARLTYELATIKQLNYGNYFLILADIVNFAKREKIKVGPGRGSAPGSLVCFLLNITEVDPIAFGLLFERFLNIERVTQPDIDIDIQDERRDEVLAYLATKYGPKRVALITTISRLGPKSALRDVARMMEISQLEISQITKWVGTWPSLTLAYEQNVRFRALIQNSARNNELFANAKKLEGFARQIGTHAAGVVIGKEALDNYFPLVKSSNNFMQLQLTMDELEPNGLLKIDLLGLRTLTIIHEIERQIFQTYQKHLSFQRIPLHDQLTNELLSAGETNGIFQLESLGMRATLMKVGVDSINDVVAIISLFRPGPMEQIALYAERKHQTTTYERISPILDEITKDTFGILIYQEQIMQIAQRFSGLSFGQADILRRAIGKKDHALIASLRQKFDDGALQQGHDLEESTRIFNLIEKFAEYGFNKSHAVAYGVLSYRMAYLKAHFRAEFYVALINAHLGSQEHLSKYVTEAKSQQILVQAPSVFMSLTNAFFDDKKNLILPLSIIKGLGPESETKIINERQNHGAFIDFFTTIARLKLIGINETLIKNLIRANTMREFGNQKTLLENLEKAKRYSQIITIKGQDGNPALDLTIIKPPQLINHERDLPNEVADEFELYGMPLVAYPTARLEKNERLGHLKLNASLRVVFAIHSKRVINDKKGQPYGKALVFDSSSVVEITIFARDWVEFSKLKAQQIVEGVITHKEYNNQSSYNLTSDWKVISE